MCNWFPLKYLQRSVRVNTNTLSQSSQHSWDKYRFIRRKITRFITIFVISHMFDDYEKNGSKILLNTQVKYYSIQEVVRFKFSTSKNMISDESSLIHVMPLHKDKEEKRREEKRPKMKINKKFSFG